MSHPTETPREKELEDALDAADRLMARYIEAVLPAAEWWRVGAVGRRGPIRRPRSCFQNPSGAGGRRGVRKAKSVSEAR